MFDTDYLSTTVVEKINFSRDETDMATASSKLDKERTEVDFETATVISSCIHDNVDISRPDLLCLAHIENIPVAFLKRLSAFDRVTMRSCLSRHKCSTYKRYTLIRYPYKRYTCNSYTYTNVQMLHILGHL